MIHDITKSPNSSKYKSLSQQWNNLIKQFKTQSKPRVDLPPIIFHRKSPLENYKNAIKLHQSVNRKKTITQKILDLSKKRKISTININENIKQHKRFNSSDHVYTLTDQEKQLLNNNQYNKSNHSNQTLRQKINTKQIIKQIKAYHQQHIARQKERQNIKEKQRYNNHNNNNTYKRQQSKSTLILHHPQNQSNKLFPNQQIRQSIREENNQTNRHQDHQTDSKNKRLSFQLSKDYKSLRYRYEKDQQSSQRFDDSIAKMLIKNRRQKVQHIFSIFAPSKTFNNNNLTESQRLLKPCSQSDYQQKQRFSQVQIIDNKSSLTTKNNSPTKIGIFSPINRKKQRNYMKKFTPTNKQLKLNMNSLSKDYEPWDDVVTESMHNESCDVDFTIQNYYNTGQGCQQIQGDNPKSKTVVIM